PVTLWPPRSRVTSLSASTYRAVPSQCRLPVSVIEAVMTSPQLRFVPPAASAGPAPVQDSATAHAIAAAGFVLLIMIPQRQRMVALRAARYQASDSPEA